jgi:hypothetical protein
MPERELRLIPLERAARVVAGPRWLSSGFTMRTTVQSPSPEVAIQLAHGSNACLRSASAIASSRVMTWYSVRSRRATRSMLRSDIPADSIGLRCGKILSRRV